MKKEILSKIFIVILSLNLSVGSANLLAWGEGESSAEKSCNTSTYSLKKLGLAVTVCAFAFACIKTPIQNVLNDHAKHQQTLKILDELSNKNVGFNIHKEISENYLQENRFKYVKLLHFYVSKGDQESFRDLLKIMIQNEVQSREILREVYIDLLFSSKSEAFLKIFLEESHEDTRLYSFYIHVNYITNLYNQKEYFNLDLAIQHSIENESSDSLLSKLLENNRPDIFLYFIRKMDRKLEPSTIDKIVYIGNQKFIHEAFKYIDFNIPFKANDQFPLEGISKYDLDQFFVYLDEKGILTEEYLFETFLLQVAYYNSNKVFEKFLDRYANHADKNKIYEKVLFSLLKQATYLNPSTLEILESYSVDLHLYEEDLMYRSIQSGNVELTKWLLKKGFKFREK